MDFAISINYLVIYTIELLIVFNYLSRLFMRKYNFKFVAAAFTVGYLLMFFLFYFKQPIINIGSFFVVNLFLAYFLFDTVNIRTALAHSVLLSVFMSVCDLLVELILAGPEGGEYYESLTTVVAHSALSKIIFFMLTLITIYIIDKQNDSRKSSIGSLVAGLVPLSIGVVIVAVEDLIRNNDLDGKYHTMLSISLVFLILASVGTIILSEFVSAQANRINENRSEARRNIQRERYYKSMEEKDEKQRIVIHDIKKHLRMISNMAEAGDNSSICSYVSSITEDIDHISYSSEYCKNPMLNLIISDYVERCRKSGITLEKDIRHLDISFLSDVELTSLFGNLLENAYEACLISKEKYISFNFKKATTSMLAITIQNSSDTAPKRSKGILHTQKTNTSEIHGVGTRSIHKVVSKHGGDEYYDYNPKEKLFTAIITFPLNETENNNVKDL